MAVDETVGEAGDDHRGRVALRAADVVPQDVVDPRIGRLQGDLEVVPVHLGVGQVAEPAVGVEHLAGRRLDDPVPAAVVPGPLGQGGVAEGDDAADHPHAAALQLGDGLLQLVLRPDGADLVGQRVTGVVPDDPALVLEIELHGGDESGVDEGEDAAPQRFVTPRRRRHVHALAAGIPDRSDDLEVGGVPRQVGGREVQRRRWWALEIEVERALGVSQWGAVHHQGRRRFHLAPDA